VFGKETQDPAGEIRQFPPLTIEKDNVLIASRNYHMTNLKERITVGLLLKITGFLHPINLMM
jgi:hypothetical protein